MPLTPPKRAVLGGLAAFAALLLALGPALGAAADPDPDSPQASAASTGAQTAVTAPVSLAILVPLTVRPTQTGLLDAATLATDTGPFGVLTRQLDAVIGTPAVIGIDPMIIASIRVLGRSAPDSAVSWLERLRTSGNETFALAYADADLATLARADALDLRTPIGFDFAIEASNFGPADTATPTPTVTSTAPATPSPTDSATPGTSPSATATAPPADQGGVPPLPTTVDEVLDWSYTLQNIAWPADGTVVSSDLGDLSRAGYTDVVLTSSNVSATDSATVDLNGIHGIVADSGITSLVRQAAYGTDPSGSEDALDRLNSALQGMAAVSPGRTVVAELDRQWPLGILNLRTLYADLAAQDSVLPVGLTTVLAGAHPSAKIVDGPANDARAREVGAALRATAQEDRFASVATPPTAITEPRRLALLSLLAVSWLRGTDDWQAQVTSFLTASATLQNSVQIVAGSDLVVGAGATNIPVTVSNALTVPVTVYVNVDSPRPALQVRAQNVALTVQPGSSNKAAIPVAALTNDQVTTTITLSSVSGVSIGSPDYVELDLHPGWESIGTTIVIVLLVIVFGGGITRNILKRRAARRAARAAGPEAEEAPENRPPDAAASTTEPAAAGTAGLAPGD